MLFVFNYCFAILIFKKDLKILVKYVKINIEPVDTSEKM